MSLPAAQLVAEIFQLHADQREWRDKPLDQSSAYHDSQRHHQDHHDCNIHSWTSATDHDQTMTFKIKSKTVVGWNQRGSRQEY